MAKSIWIGATFALLLAGAGLTSGCGDDDENDGTPATGGTTGTGGMGGAGTGGAGTGGTATGGEAGGGGEGGMGGCSGTQLTVFNTLAWCDVSIAGADSSSALQQTVCVPSGEVELTAEANPGFRLGDTPWHETDGDTGNGEQGEVTGDVSTTTVTVSGDGTECVWVCCEFAAGGGCDVPNPCD